jgi:hypothetical protein
MTQFHCGCEKIKEMKDTIKVKTTPSLDKACARDFYHPHAPLLLGSFPLSTTFWSSECVKLKGYFIFLKK